MPIDENVVYVCEEPLVENRKLTVRTYKITNKEKGCRVFLAQYVGYYRHKSWTVALYPHYNPYAQEQSKAKRHVISARLINSKLYSN